MRILDSIKSLLGFRETLVVFRPGERPETYTVPAGTIANIHVVGGECIQPPYDVSTAYVRDYYPDTNVALGIQLPEEGDSR